MAQNASFYLIKLNIFKYKSINAIRKKNEIGAELKGRPVSPASVRKNKVFLVQTIFLRN